MDPWCSLVNTSPCHGEDRRFKSGRVRKSFVIMKAVIVAAGEGVRMRPLTLTTPKPLLTLRGKSLLRHVAEALPASVDELILVIGYRGDQIKEHCGVEFLGRKVIYVTQTERNGTFHALELCKAHLPAQESFAFLYADDYLDPASVAECLSYPRAVVAARAEHPERFGVITLNKDGTVKNIEEKPVAPRSNLVLGPVCVVTPDIFRYAPPPHPASGERYFASALGMMAEEYPVKVVEAKLWIPIGTPEDLTRAER